MAIKYIAIFIVILKLAQSHENAGSNVAPSLIECYTTPALNDRDRRFPATINVLIDLFRRVEDGKTNLDARSLAVSSIYRFRQDGIQSVPSKNSLILPYTPKGFQVSKNRILLTKLIPGSVMAFPNETLNALQKCSMHFMLSNSVETKIRNDENEVCGKLGRYVSRMKRGTGPKQQVERISAINSSNRKKGNLEAGDASNNTFTETNPGSIQRTNSRGDIDEQKISDCPVEGGVIDTRWGAVQAGIVLGGLAAGLEKQFIDILNMSIDNRFAATLSADLAETALWQGLSEGTYDVGASGGWNSTLVPRWYFISQKKNYELSDAEIRGGLDGLVIAKNIEEWKRDFATLKISQVLDMYYSDSGVFGSKIRACNRHILRSEFVSEEDLKEQTLAFGYLYNIQTVLPGSVINENVPELTKKAVDSYLAYDARLNVASCDPEFERVSTELLIVLDTSWPYKNIQPVISYILDNVDVNKYGTNYTIMNGNDGNIIVNTSNSILDFHEIYNESLHEQESGGFQAIRVLEAVEQYLKNRVDEDKVTSNSGGKSVIVLLLPFTQTLPNDESIFAESRKGHFKSYLPDVKVLVLGAGSKDAYSSLVSSIEMDAFSLPQTTDDNSLKPSIMSVIKRFREIPRRITNPRCGSNFNGDDSSNSMDQYVEPGTTNYYKISPNYFHGEGAKTLKVRGQGSGSLVVCGSRSVERPRQNASSSGGDITCESVNSNEISFSLGNICNGETVSACNPYYLSVEAAAASDKPPKRCMDAGCRFPHNIKYVVATEGFVCHNSASQALSSFILISFLLYMLNL